MRDPDARSTDVIDGLSAFFSGIATVFILVLGLALIFSAGPLIGCATTVLIVIAWAYVRSFDA